VWDFTYLKALPGERDRLERFIAANWFVPDERARARGYISGYQLLRAAPADTSWDVLVIDIFPDSAAKAAAPERYRTEIMPGHTKQLVDGRDFPQLGRIVRQHTLVAVTGHVGG
jgi:hypothetical protein